MFQQENMECESMKRKGYLLWAAGCTFLAFGLGCGAPQVQGTPAHSAKTCIQGKVWMKSPVEPGQVPYGGVVVNAWRHGKDLALAETKTQTDGSFCIEVPLESRVDLRVWGMERMGGKTYICEGSVQNIDPGTTPKKCGEDCFKTDIVTQCQEWVGRRIGG
jgi:hypothetical protein